MKTSPDRGYSLIEFIVVIFLIGILAGFAFLGLFRAIEVYNTSSRNYLELFQGAKIALDKMARELRESNPASVIITTGEIAFARHTGTPQDPSLTVTFSQEGNNITRATAAGSYLLLDNVKANSFLPSQDANDVVTLPFTVSSEDTEINLRTSILPRQWD